MEFSKNLDLPAKLIMLRKDMELSQEELAKQLNIGQATLSQWETGSTFPGFNAIVKLCEFFEISADYLCGFVDEQGCYAKQYKGLNSKQELFVNMFNNLSKTQSDVVLRLMEEFFAC